MAKKKPLKPVREVTHRQRSRWQKQRRIQRLIMAAFILILVAVITTITTGWYINSYRPWHEPVIKVNGTEFDLNYYATMLTYYGRGLSSDYLFYIADGTAYTIQENELIRQEAEKIGIRVSDKELDQHYQSFDPPLSKDYREAIRAELLQDKLLDEYFDKQVPLEAEQRHVLAMLLESPAQADQVRGQLLAGGVFTDFAQAHTLETYTQDNKGDLDWQPREVLSLNMRTDIPVEYAFSAEEGVISQPLYDAEHMKDVGYWLIKVMDRNEEDKKNHLMAILLGSDDEAEKVRARLEAGEDFAVLAQELSQHEYTRENGGNFDWVSKGEMTSVFDGYAFDTATEIGALSPPIRDITIQTKGGYWLVQVTGIEANRPLSDEQRTLLKNQALEEWIAALWDNPENEVESYLDEARMMRAIERVIGG